METTPSFLATWGIHVARLLRHVEHADGPPFRDHPSADRLAHLQVRLVDVILAQALRRRDHQFLLLLVEEHYRADLRAHHLGRHGHDELEDLLQIVIRHDGAADLREEVELLGLLVDLFVDHGVLDGAAEVLGDGEEQVYLVLRVFVLFLVVDVHHADDLVLRKYRHRQKGLELVLGQVGEALEPRDRCTPCSTGRRASSPLRPIRLRLHPASA